MCPAHKMSACLAEHHRAAPWQIPRSKCAFDLHFRPPLGWRHRQRCRDVFWNWLWTVLLVFISSALRMLLLSTWTKIRLKRVFAFFHGTGRRPLIDVDVPILLVTLIEVEFAIILFMHCSNSQFKTPASASAAILILSQIPCNPGQKKIFVFFLWHQQRLSF